MENTDKQQIETQPTKKRLEYIDALRGFTMTLVVISHVLLFSFNIESEHQYTNIIFGNMRMPLFFFICGFLSYRANLKWNLKTYKENLAKKLQIQIIPTLILGSLYALLVMKTGLLEFITTHSKLGYWFTISLLEMFIIYYTTSLIMQSIYKNKEIPAKVFNSTLIAVAFFVYCCIFLTNHPMTMGVCNTLSLYYTTKFYIFFTAGIIASKYKECFFNMLNKEKFIIAALLIFALCTVLIQTSGNKLTEHIYRNTIAFAGIFFLICFFRKNENVFKKTTTVGKVLQYIGTRTLDIYLLHYFFIPHLPQVGNFIKGADNFVVEFTIALIVSALIIGFCLLVSNVLRTSSLLGHFLFGAKIDKNK